ncbi:hypothetical protein ACYFX5_10200 [Bremerella sp. T1]|uniref:hypothetical protein n=1 Tax=Bremerella sp. TYQ1 TaxID=3119568 RepID=UPI001CCF899B|nr:hypothetical protein [Bremerella volcania]UBM38620.1 hypothetical protein LA756_12145 [Bremerella volcania]
MWKTLLSAIVVMVAVTLSAELFRNTSSAWAQKQHGLPVSSGLVVHNMPCESGGQFMVMVDPETRVLAVYHVEGNGGKVSLKSVRNLQWDLLIEEFNGGEPSPREIRTLLNQP